jgi:hypothetical protein
MDKILDSSYFKTFNFFIHRFSQITTDQNRSDKIRGNR